MPSFEKRQKPKLHRSGGGSSEIDIKDRRHELPEMESTISEIDKALQQGQDNSHEVEESGCICFGDDLDAWNPFGR